MSKNESHYPVLALEPNVLAESIQENLEGQKIKSHELDQILVPTGKSTKWEVEGIDGVSNVDTIDVIIISKRSERTFWEDPDAEGPPDCQSSDGKQGHPNKESGASCLDIIGGACEGCPMNEWGSAAKGGGKACTEKLALLALVEGQMLPVVIKCNTTSLKAAKKFFMRLASFSQPYYTVMTTLGLEQHKKGSNQWNTVTFTRSRVLTPDEVEKVKSFRGMMTESMG